jgi:hypothetical protein
MRPSSGEIRRRKLLRITCRGTGVTGECHPPTNRHPDPSRSGRTAPAILPHRKTWYAHYPTGAASSSLILLVLNTR